MLDGLVLDTGALIIVFLQITFGTSCVILIIFLRSLRCRFNCSQRTFHHWSVLDGDPPLPTVGGCYQVDGNDVLFVDYALLILMETSRHYPCFPYPISNFCSNNGAHNLDWHKTISPFAQPLDHSPLSRRDILFCVSISWGFLLSRPLTGIWCYDLM